MFKILVIEGQFNLPLLWNGLIKPILARFPGQIDAKSISWDQEPNTPSLASGGVPYNVVVAHSLGGDMAIRFASRGIGTRPKALITVDPRHCSNWGWLDMAFRWQKDFVAPSRVESFNFTHKPAVFLPGYNVTNAVNTAISSNHFSICSSVELFNCLARLVVINQKPAA
jgi:hypothetical protein